ncbi:hypothetical protein FALBO_8907 [Fusarium albosuccineum]|uniref:FHA domain-containing protein n=1 Tax=Fusarium albosuccineum TaxID=1237068 RepID=A0A8H4LAC2_9HYPO|nr:hypothetical protein FALBO_8907 [Fusarium albosuccineum]
MAVPQYRDEVLVTLTSIDPSSDFAFPDRRFFLTKEKPIVEIGRTSKRNTSFEAAKNNAWFDSAVMSRTHAHLKLDVDKQKVYIKDTKSLHGTFKNDQRLPRGIPSGLTSGDKLRFGISIDRGMDRYPPCTLEARLRFGTVDPQDRPKVFRVPDDSDVDDSCSEDDQQVDKSYEILRTMKIHPAAFPSSSPSRSPIDLTNDQYPLSSVRGDADLMAGAIPEVSSTMKHPEITDARNALYSRGELEDTHEDASASPDGGWPFSEVEGDADEQDEDEEDHINLSQSTDVDTESSHCEESDDLSVDYAASSIAEDYNDPEVDMDEDDFEEHDEFECDEGMDRLQYDDRTIVDLLPDFPRPQYVPGNSMNEALIEEFPAMDETPAGPRLTALGTISTEPQEVDSVESMAPQSQRSNHGKSAQVGAVDYLLNPAVPSIEPTSTFTSVRLPSISEAVAMSPYKPSQNSGLVSTAEAMGRKTGKYEFFAARAENKANAFPSSSQPQTQQMHQVRIEVPAPQRATSFPFDEPETIAPVGAAIPMVFGAAPSQHTTPQETEEQPRTPKEQELRLGDSELAASGADFLNTPPQEPETPCPKADLALDETSAYQFELSKKAVDAAKITTESTEEPMEPVQMNGQEVSDEAMVTPPDVIQEPHNAEEVESGATNEAPRDLPETPRPVKRKAEDISQLTPEEEHVHTTRRRRRGVKSRPLGTEIPRLPISTVVAPPPTKRLRRVAEVVGYAALGGMAVMSALIATAPTL